MPDDPQKTQMGAPPSVDPNRTIVTSAPSLNTTQTIKPVQCPVCKSHNPPGHIYCVECGLIFGESLPDDAFGAPAVQLPVLVEDTGREHALRPGENVVGRQGDVMVSDDRVSRQHAKVTLGDDQAVVEDLGSTNGSKLNGDALAEGDKLPFNDGDILSLGGFELRLSMPGEASKTELGLRGKTSAISAPPTVDDATAWLIVEGEEHILRIGEQSFGRRDGNDIVIPNPYVSGQHGKIEAREDGIYMTDLGSTNGTFVNGARLGEGQTTKIEPGDDVKLGELAAVVRFRE